MGDIRRLRGHDTAAFALPLGRSAVAGKGTVEGDRTTATETDNWGPILPAQGRSRDRSALVLEVVPWRVQ